MTTKNKKETKEKDSKPKRLIDRWADEDVILKVDTRRKDELRKRFRLDVGDKNVPIK